MIVVQIEDPEDGRVSHEVGPFDDVYAATLWRSEFLDTYDFDGDFIAVREIDFRLYNPLDKESMDEIEEFYSAYTDAG